MDQSFDSAEWHYIGVEVANAATQTVLQADVPSVVPAATQIAQNGLGVAGSAVAAQSAVMGGPGVIAAGIGIVGMVALGEWSRRRWITPQVAPTNPPSSPVPVPASTPPTTPDRCTTPQLAVTNPPPSTSVPISASSPPITPDRLDSISFKAFEFAPVVWHETPSINAQTIPTTTAADLSPLTREPQAYCLTTDAQAPSWAAKEEPPHVPAPLHPPESASSQSVTKPMGSTALWHAASVTNPLDSTTLWHAAVAGFVIGGTFVATVASIAWCRRWQPTISRVGCAWGRQKALLARPIEATVPTGGPQTPFGSIALPRSPAQLAAQVGSKQLTALQVFPGSALIQPSKSLQTVASRDVALAQPLNSVGSTLIQASLVRAQRVRQAELLFPLGNLSAASLPSPGHPHSFRTASVLESCMSSKCMDPAPSFSATRTSGIAAPCGEPTMFPPALERKQRAKIVPTIDVGFSIIASANPDLKPKGCESVGLYVSGGVVRSRLPTSSRIFRILPSR